MTRNHTLSLLSLAVLASLAAAPALAQDSPYFYGGFGLGSSKSKLDQNAQSNTLLPITAIPVSIDTNNQDTAYKLFGGYQLNRYFGVEAGYFDLGKFSYTTTTTTLPPAVAGTLHSEKKVQGVNIDGVGTWPFTERFAAIARLGVQNAKASTKLTSSGSAGIADTSTGKRDTNYKLGVGLQFAFSPSVILRGEAERYRINDGISGRGNVNVFSASLVFPFGRSASSKTSSTTPTYQPYQPVAILPSTPLQPEPAPQAAVAPLAQAPVAVVAPLVMPVAAPTRQRVSFQAESLFAFDTSTVQPSGQIALNNFSQQISGTHYDEITVEGHTDRIGTPEYNQALSLQRADAVKSYLVTNGRLDAASITAVGKSESQPITKAGDCQGSVASARLIECLKADRRVEIELTGKR